MASNAYLGNPSYLFKLPFASFMMEKIGGSFKLIVEYIFDVIVIQ